MVAVIILLSLSILQIQGISHNFKLCYVKISSSDELIIEGEI